jgi:hypothetical protein
MTNPLSVILEESLLSYMLNDENNIIKTKFALLNGKISKSMFPKENTLSMSI